MKSVESKSAKHDELIQIGYGILGTVEEQWSDLDVSRN